MKALASLLRRLFKRSSKPAFKLPPLKRAHLLCLHVEQATDRASSPNPFPFAR
ncbi:MAG: hypothetical protein Q8M19_17250 [Reyranella sp.]|nr:hypothetical protein [Reyranella sp.]